MAVLGCRSAGVRLFGQLPCRLHAVHAALVHLGAGCRDRPILSGATEGRFNKGIGSLSVSTSESASLQVRVGGQWSAVFNASTVAYALPVVTAVSIVPVVSPVVGLMDTRGGDIIVFNGTSECFELGSSSAVTYPMPRCSSPPFQTSDRQAPRLRLSALSTLQSSAAQRR